MMQPHEFARRVLVCVTGLSPQVVTETIYALSRLPQPWLPTEVHILTTVTGAQRARLLLLAPDRDNFARLVHDYALGEIAFGDDSIHVIADASGRPLDDIRTQADNMAVADGILRHIAAIAADDDAAIHVSLAGGRKSMGFFAGYALSLCGRAQDRLSHVLVSSEFESHSDFFFPPRTPRVLLTRADTPVSTADAVVELADIPFVRLRDHAPAALIEEGAFTDVVLAAQRLAEPPSLNVNIEARAIECAGEKVALPPMRLAVYAWHAWRAQNEADPTVPLLDFDALGSPLREELRRFGARMFPNPHSAEAEGWNDRKWNDDAALHADWLSVQRTRINQKIRQVLGDEGVRIYGIRSVSTGAGKQTGHRLDLAARQIVIEGR